MAKRQPKSVRDFCVARFGQFKGGVAAAHTIQWALVTRELGHVATTVQYAEWWAVDERTAWRHRADIREVFGDQWQAVVENVAAHIDSKLSRRAAVNVAVPSKLRPAV